MYENIQDTHEGNETHKRKYISYLLTGRINIVNTSILPTAIYISLQSLSKFQNFSQNKQKNSTTCIKLLLFSCQVMSESYWRHRLQRARLPCPLPSPRICPSSCPLNWWCHPTISSSVSLFFFCLQSFPASGSFPMSQLFTLGGQCIGASASVLLKSVWSWFLLRLTGFDLLGAQGTLKSLVQHHSLKALVFSTLSSLLSAQLLHVYMTTGKSLALTIQTSVGKVMFLLLTHCLGLSQLSCQETIVF